MSESKFSLKEDCTVMSSPWVCEVLDSIPDSVYTEAASLPGFGLYHSSSWHRVIFRAFGWRVRAVVARSPRGDISWFLPFVVKWRYPNHLAAISLPFSHYIEPAKVLLQEQDDFERSNAISGAVENFPHFELHGSGPIAGMNIIEQGWRYEMDLSSYSDPASLLRSLDRKSIQQRVARAKRENLFVTNDAQPHHLVAFSELVAHTRQRKGSPAHSTSFYETLHREFSGHGAFNLHLTWSQSHLLAGVLFIDHGDSSMCYASGSIEDKYAAQMGANQLAKWEGVSSAFDRGIRYIDMGNTRPNQGSLRDYKLGWATNSIALHYCVRGGASQNEETLSLIDRGLQWTMRKIPKKIHQKFSPLITKLII